MHNDPLLQILILLAASVLVVAGVRKLALPAILGYLVVGMLLGPHALEWAVDNETTRLLADFGVVFLVFTLGLEFSLPRLVAMRNEVLGVGGSQVVLTTAVVALALVLAAGRWLLRPLFLLIASVRSSELFSLAVLLAVLASAWATHAAGLSLALGAFLAGMMLAE